MELRVVLLLPLCFPGFQAQTPEELSQREGSNLSVLCPFLAEDEYQEVKSWCRWTDQGCQPQVEIIGRNTYTHTDRARQGHVTIQDDPIHRNFSITMTDLRVEDSGTYYCAYRKAWERFVLLKRISLNVFKGPAATTLSVTTGTNQNYLPGNSTQAGLWSFTLWALLGFFINKVLVILLLVFLQRRGHCRKEKCRAAEGSPGQLPEEKRS